MVLEFHSFNPKMLFVFFLHLNMYFEKKVWEEGFSKMEDFQFSQEISVLRYLKTEKLGS